MKLLIVRHGDPDYDIDSLTEKGCRRRGTGNIRGKEPFEGTLKFADCPQLGPLQ